MRYYSDSAIALFDGGWRAADRDALKDEYQLEQDELDAIVEDLRGMENDLDIPEEE